MLSNTMNPIFSTQDSKTITSSFSQVTISIEWTTAKCWQVHTESKADITVSVIPVKKEDTSGLGILQADTNGRIVNFVEKPQTEAELLPLRVEPEVFTARGIQAEGREYIASMGIYIFNHEVLHDFLKDDSNVDFGQDIIPKSIQTHPVSAYFFDGYWEDIGTIRSFLSREHSTYGPHTRFQFLR